MENKNIKFQLLLPSTLVARVQRVRTTQERQVMQPLPLARVIRGLLEKGVGAWEREQKAGGR